MKKIIFIAAIMLFFNNIFAQDYVINNITDGFTIYKCNGYIYDDGHTLNYSNNINTTLTICSDRQPGQMSYKRLSLFFEEFSLSDGDIFKIYSGTETTANQLSSNTIYDFSNNDINGIRFISLEEDTTGCLTIQFNSDGINVSTGFKIKIECIDRCQPPISALDTFFLKVLSDESIISFPIKDGADTIYHETGDSIKNILKFKSIDICDNDSIILIPNPIFPDSEFGYYQGKETCIYEWSFGNNKFDTTYYENNRTGHKWNKVDGYDLNLIVRDTNNFYLTGEYCNSKNSIDVRIRIAKNPIKSINPIPDLCSGETFNLTTDYGGNSTINVDSLVFQKEFKESFAATIFIPDGPNCNGAGSVVCYESPVMFDQFKQGLTIQSGTDIKSICLNMEHSYIGDISIYLRCPNGQQTALKTFPGGGSIYMGIPYNGNNHAIVDFADNQCTSPPNVAGAGWWYCFSNITSSMGYLNNCPTVTTSNASVNANNCVTCDSSDMYTGNDYYLPDQDFSGLIGCPMNGQWSIVVCDQWGIDNGFVFAWQLELSSEASSSWDYSVDIDSVIWEGPFINQIDITTSSINPPIEAQTDTYSYDISVVDEFNCVWKTENKINIVQTPIPNLGNDTIVCENTPITLNPHFNGAWKYLWEPGGEMTETKDIIATKLSVGNYMVQIVNTNGNLYCYKTDDINISIHPSIYASFTSNMLPLEGCEPYTFTLINTSENAETNIWAIGQLKSTEVNPEFTLPYGIYDLYLKSISKEGCVDSVFQPNFINVFKQPFVDFSWTPYYPTTTNSKINLINLTTPYNSNNYFRWMIQTDKNSQFIENIFGYEPSYEWKMTSNNKLTGDYKIILDGCSINYGLSGRLYECHDTISKIISIINDNLMSPNIITPNNDGINDCFSIINLSDGQACPDNIFTIYDRNGKLLFYAEDIRNAYNLWCPDNNIPTGTYFYKFIANCVYNKKEFKGSITILK